MNSTALAPFSRVGTPTSLPTIWIAFAAAVVAAVAATPNSPQSFNVTINDQSSVALSFELRGLERQSVAVGGNQYDLYQIVDEPISGDVGMPLLPSISRTVLIPPECGVRLTVSHATTRTEHNGCPITCPDAEITSAGDVAGLSAQQLAAAPRQPLTTDRDGFYPAQIAESGTPAILRGHRLIQLIVHPVRWNPLTGETQLVESADISLDFNTSQNRDNLVENPSRPRPSRFADRLVRAIVVNPPPERDDVDFGGSIVYVLGTGDAWDGLLEEVQPLIDWRRQMGWKVETIRVDDPTDRNAVKSAIQDAYDNWETPPEYIVLCGDTDGDYAIAYWNKAAGAGNPYESDTPYVLLEGDDYLPDAAIGRLVAYDREGMRGQVEKIIGYESDPYMGEGSDQGWFTRAAVAATSSILGESSKESCRWFRDVAKDRGFTDVGELYFDDNQAVNLTDFINHEFNEVGISFFLYHGWVLVNLYSQHDAYSLRNGRMLPFVILAGDNSADYGEPNVWGDVYSYAEIFASNPDGGAIGCVGGAGAGSDEVAYSNLFASGALRGPFVEGIYSQGWALMRGKLSLYTQYAGRGDRMHSHNRNMEAWETMYWIYNLMGDPAVDLYTAVPKELNVDRPDAIRQGETRFAATVTDAENDVPVSGAIACLYKPGEFQLRGATDPNGQVLFAMDDEWTQEGEIYFTVTGHNLKPCLETYQVEQAARFFGAGTPSIDDDNHGASQGDGDGIANPTETLELAIPVVNYGNERPDGEMSALLTISSPNVEVVLGDTVFHVTPEAGDSVMGNFIIRIGGGFSNGEQAQFRLQVVVAGESWFSAVAIPVVAPNMEFESLEWLGDPLAPGGSASMRLSLRNRGAKESPRINATLLSLTPTINVISAQARFAAMEIGGIDTSGDTLEVTASKFHFIGNPAQFALALQGENGFLDTAFFSVMVDDSDDTGKPFGPDGYGYLCYDDGDTGWVTCPQYHWIEVDPDLGGNGTDTELRDAGEEKDKSTVIAFPDDFHFQYYGQPYDSITICTNGWAALGSRGDRNTFCNRRIPDGECVPAMLCPFWDDLITTNDGGIFYWFDSDSNRFVIEWNKMRRYGPRAANESLETFQIVLYDPDYYPSFTGDGNIEFQYRDVSDDSSSFQVFETPFATVGLVSPDLTTGLEYVYWNNYHIGASRLQDERVIKFTTQKVFAGSGWVRGAVTDLATGDGIAGVKISTPYGFYSPLNMTDEAGHYLIPILAVDSCSLKFHKQGWNDSTVTGVDVHVGDTVEVNIALLHPEFLLSPDEMALQLMPDTSVSREATLSNHGNGPLEFTSRLDDSLRWRDDPDDLWDELLGWNATDSTGNNRIACITFAAGKWVVAADVQGRTNPGKFYLFRRNGAYLGESSQPDSGVWIRDMEYRNGYIYAATKSQSYLKLNPETLEKIYTVSIPGMEMGSLAGLTVSTDGVVYATKALGPIMVLEEVDDSTAWNRGSIDVDDPATGVSILISGLSWFRDDPDGCQLYIIGATQPEAPGKHLYKLNTQTGEIRLITDFPQFGEYYHGKGISITSRWNTSVVVMAAVLDHPDGDQIKVFNLGPNAVWLDYNPSSGALESGEAVDLLLDINTAGLEWGDYKAVIDFFHNAVGGITQLPISLHVGPVSVPDANSGSLEEFRLEQNFPNPFNGVTIIGYGIPSAMRVRIAIYDLSGRLLSELVNERQAGGAHRLATDLSAFPSGVYLCRLEAGEMKLARKIVMLK